uniref:Uncharacterized protein n=1 Tax=Anguilla anguilla TaxID=7936 RepID=A0A0E9PZG1_ANGAN
MTTFAQYLRLKKKKRTFICSPSTVH